MKRQALIVIINWSHTKCCRHEMAHSLCGCDNNGKRSKNSSNLKRSKHRSDLSIFGGRKRKETSYTSLVFPGTFAIQPTSLSYQMIQLVINFDKLHLRAKKDHRILSLS